MHQPLHRFWQVVKLAAQPIPGISDAVNYFAALLVLVGLGYLPSVLPNITDIPVVLRACFMAIGAIALMSIAAFRLKGEIDTLRDQSPLLVPVRLELPIFTFSGVEGRRFDDPTLWLARIVIANEGKGAAIKVTAHVSFVNATTPEPIPITPRDGWWCDYSLDEGGESASKAAYVKEATFAPNHGRWCLDIARKFQGVPSDFFAMNLSRLTQMSMFDVVWGNSFRVRVELRGEGLLEPTVWWFELGSDSLEGAPRFSQIVDKDKIAECRSFPMPSAAWG